MNLPWIGVTTQSRQRAQQNVNRGLPLTTSYPQAIFAVTAQNGAPLSPGQSKWPRIFGNSTTGDPRATGTFYDVSTNANLQNLITGGTPTTVAIGGNSYNAAGTGSNSIIWIVIAALVVLFFVE